MTDADTTAHAETLWELARAVRETISQDGEVNWRTSDYTLADLRRLADGLPG